MGMYARAAIAGLIAGVLTSIVVPLVPAIVTFGVAATGDGGTAEASFNLSPLSPLFLAGFAVAFAWSIIREKRRRRLPSSR